MFVGALIGAWLASCGSTRRRRRCSWAIPGSLALGGALGTIAVVANHEIVLLLIGGLFVLEAISVIVQVFCFKRPASACSRWRRSTTTTNSSAGANRPSSSASGSSSLVLALAGLATLKLR